MFSLRVLVVAVIFGVKHHSQKLRQGHVFRLPADGIERMRINFSYSFAQFVRCSISQLCSGERSSDVSDFLVKSGGETAVCPLWLFFF